MSTDITTEKTTESIYTHGRLLAEQDTSNKAILERLMVEEAEQNEEVDPPGLADGFQNVIKDFDVVGATSGLIGSVASDTLQGIRALFSPAESTSAAILSQFSGEEDPVEVFKSRMFQSLTGQEGINYAGQVAEKTFPDQGPLARAATEFGLSMVSDPSMYVGMGILPAVRKGIRRVGQGKSQTVLRGAVDDLVENVPVQNADELAQLALKAESGDPKAVKSLERLLGERAGEWELASVRKDAYRLTTHGGEGQTVPAKARRLQQTLTQKRSQGDVALFSKELDAPIPSPHKLQSAYLNLNGPDDVNSLVGTYVNETSNYVAKALEQFPPTSIQGLQVRAALKEQHHFLADTVGDVVNRELTDVEAFAYRRMLTDLGANILKQVHKSEMKFRSNVDRLRFYKLIGAREQVRAELSLVKNEGSTLLSKLTTAASNDAVRVVQAERAIGKIPEILSGKEERYIAQALANLDKGDQATVFLNQVFDHTGNLKGGLEKKIHTYWMNSILSGPITHGRNAMVNGLNILLKPVEHAMIGDLATARQQAIGMAEGTMDVLRVFTRLAPKHPQNYREYKHMHEMSAHAPRLSKEALSQLPLYQRGWHFFTANMLGGPTKALGEADAVFKSIAQRQDVRAQAVELASRMTEDTAVRKQLIERFLRNPMQLMEQKAFKQAERMTFQNPMSDRATGLHQNAAKYGITKWIVPFVKTPMNIVTYGMRYTPYAPMFKQVRRDIAKGGTAADLSLARMTAIPLSMTSMALMMGDNITGGRNAYLNQNQIPPYSIRWGDKWISYQRIEPLRWTLGPAADLKDLLQEIDWESSDASTIWGQAVAGVAGAYLKPMLDVHFMGAVAEVATGIEEGSGGNWNRIGRIIQSASLGMIPNIASQTNRIFFDDSVRQLGDYLSKLKSRVPGLSPKLPQKVGLLGEPQTHQSWINEGAASDHPIYPVMNMLGMDVPRIPRIINGHELNGEQRNMFMRFRAGTANIQSGPTLADSYRQLLESPTFQRTDKETRVELIQNITNMHTLRAKEIMLMNYPHIQEKPNE